MCDITNRTKQMKPDIYLLGFGSTALDETKTEILLQSRHIITSGRLYELLKNHPIFNSIKDKTRIITKVDEIIHFIKKESATGNTPVSVTATGDPLFFGIGRRMLQNFSKDQLSILPDLSSIQLAFARIKDTWDDAFFVTLHGRDNLSEIPRLVKNHSKLCILTDPQNSPTKIAQLLCKFPYLNVKFYVGECLGSADEKVTEGTPEQIATMTFRQPNLTIVKKLNEGAKEQILFGLSEDDIEHSKGLITKDEVRAVSIHKLKIPSKGVLWDIGAGSGAVSAEIASLAPGIEVYSVEKDERQLMNIENNKARFALPNLIPVHGTAPEILTGMPKPDRIFIGGSGGKLKEILEVVASSKCPVVVLNAITLESLNQAVTQLSACQYSVSACQVSVCRLKNLKTTTYFSALNPIFVVEAIYQA